MRLTIAERLRPYSHMPGVFVVVPGSDLRLQVFPALIRLHRMGAGEPQLLDELALLIPGSLADFTVCQDLEEGCVRLWGRSSEGFLRLRVGLSTDGAVVLTCEKAPLSIKGSFGERLLQSKESITLLSGGKTPPVPLPTARLSLGSHKAQEWESLWRHRDVHSIFPLWFRLGYAVPAPAHVTFTGTLALLRDIPSLPPETIIPRFQQLLRAGFDALLAPRLVDVLHQGFHLPPPSSHENPLALLSEGAKCIRSLLIQQNKYELALLPHVPPEFHCGRFLGVNCDGLAELSMEWTKKRLRQVLFIPKASGEWRLIIRGDIRRYRLRRTVTERGEFRVHDAPLIAEAGQHYFLDNFEK